MENVERYQSLSKNDCYTCYVISAGSRWAELCSLSLTSKGSLSWANILTHFHWANLTLAAPRRRTWQWQMRQCVEDWGGGGRRGEGASGGSPREGWLPPRGETLTHWPRLVASQCKQPLAQGAASESTHFYTWTNSETGQEKRPTHHCISPSLPFSFPPSKNTIRGTIRCLLTSTPLSFLFVLRWLCTYISCALCQSLKTLFAVMDA